MHLHVTVSQGFGGPRSSSSFSCTCICITKHFFSLTDTAASASAILLQQTAPWMGVGGQLQWASGGGRTGTRCGRGIGSCSFTLTLAQWELQPTSL